MYDVDVEELIKLYNNGYTIRSICKRFGISSRRYNNIITCLKKQNRLSSNKKIFGLTINDIIVNRDGTLINRKSNKLIKPWKRKGSTRPRLYIKTRDNKVHYIEELVGQKYLNYTPGKGYIHFKDMNRNNCNVDNLEIKDYKQVIKPPEGDYSYSITNMSDELKQIIINKYNLGAWCSEIGKEFNITVDTVRKVLREHGISKEQNTLRSRYRTIDDVYADDNGIVRFKHNDEPLKTLYDRYGYVKINLNNTNYPAHRIVALLRVPTNDTSLHINHINGIKDDNRPENLEWVTPKENLIHAYKFLNRIENNIYPIQDTETGMIYSNFKEYCDVNNIDYCRGKNRRIYLDKGLIRIYRSKDFFIIFRNNTIRRLLAK